MSVWNKWLHWLNRDDKSLEETERLQQKQQPIEKERTNRTDVELEEARMTYHYGNQEWGNSRKETRREEKKKTQFEQQKVADEGMTTHKESGEKRKRWGKQPAEEEEQPFFQGTFKPSVIPSPVHGVQKKEEKRENSDYDWLIFQTRDQQAEFAERLFNKPVEVKSEPAFLRKNTKQLEEDVLAHLQQQSVKNSNVEVSEEGNGSAEGDMVAAQDSTLEHTYSSDSSGHSESQGDSQESVYQTELEEDQHTANESDILPADDPRLVTEKAEGLVAVASDERQEATVVEIEEPTQELKVAEMNQLDAAEGPKDLVSSEKQDMVSPVHSDSESIIEIEKPQPPVPDNKRNDRNQENEAPKKGGIPFNVLMLPKDRQQKPKPSQRNSNSTYGTPPLNLLNIPEKTTDDDSGWLDEQAALLEETLASFHVDAKVVDRTKGPAVTRFEIQPARGVKVNKITNLTDDIKLALAAKDIRMEAPIPGKNAIGIEVPNRHSSPVMLREILRRDVFRNPDSPLTAALGLDISGQPIVTDLKKMPHGLVAGATGSGKSVCINSILVSLLYKASPEELKLLLVDPKMVELAPYHDVPHLLAPVITDPKQATAALKWVVQEMERRYELFSRNRVRDIGKYNERFSTEEKPALPYMLVVIDELADLMMVSPQDVEDSICRIAQKARACGIHLLVATQRPSVDVITGLIKANIPTRIAFAVASQMDSRTILDMGGAERLLGRGDMLFHENGAPKAIRVQGTFVSDEEIEAVVEYAKQYGKPEYAFDTEMVQKAFAQEEDEDELLEEACYFAVEHGTTSASSIQRRFRVGYNRAARLIEMMEVRGVVSGAMGSKPRQVLATEEEINQLFAGPGQTTGT